MTTTTQDTRPERELETQTLTVPARELAAGDVLVSYLQDEPGHDVATVERVDVKQAWTYVHVEDETDAPRFRNDEPVEVRRQVETEASIAARRAWYIEESAADLLVGYAGQLASAQQTIVTAIARNHVITSEQMANLAATQILVRETAGYAAAVEDGKLASYSDAVRKLREKFTTALVERGQTFWSGGFTYSNAEEQIAQEAYRGFLRATQYWFES